MRLKFSSHRGGLATLSGRLRPATAHQRAAREAAGSAASIRVHATAAAAADDDGRAAIRGLCIFDEHFSPKGHLDEASAPDRGTMIYTVSPSRGDFITKNLSEAEPEVPRAFAVVNIMSAATVYGYVLCPGSSALVDGPSTGWLPYGANGHTY